MTTLFDWKPKWHTENDRFAAQWSAPTGAAFLRDEQHNPTPENAAAHTEPELSITDIAWADGFAAGQQAAVTENATQQALAQAIAGLSYVPNVVVEDALCSIVNRAIAHIFSSTDVTANEVQNYVAQSLAVLPQSIGHCRIMLHPDDAAFLGADTALAGYELCLDAAMPQGNVRIEHEHGIVEQGRNTALRMLQNDMVPPC